ncbi:MAG: EAL domain-containing protein [Mycobacteriales bacterium]
MVGTSSGPGPPSASDGVEASSADWRARPGHERELFTAVFHATHEAMIVTDVRGVVVEWNPAAERLYGYSSHEAIGQNVSMLYAPERLPALAALVADALDTGSTSIDQPILRKDGSTVHVSGSVSRINDVAGLPTALVGITRDVSDTARLTQQLREQAEHMAHLALHDPLTGLANRSLLNDRLTRALTSRRKPRVSLLLLDLDDFKSVNDVHGHAAGDQLLVEVARRMSDCVRAEDTVARLGGDEFAFLVEDSDAEPMAQRVLEQLALPVSIEGCRVVPKGSIGIAHSEQSSEAETLLLHADIAMYAAKAAGKGRFAHFDPAMAETVRERAARRDLLSQAVARGEVVVHFQPVMDVHAECLSRLEALVRWQRPEGLVPPLEFLPMAEETGLIIGIGQEVLRQVCDQLHDWLAADRRRSVAVNVSTVQLRDGDFPADVQRLLADCDARPEQLVLEVTESLFLEQTPALVEQLVALRALGVRVTIDDFGTGYSSLGRLQALPVDSLKIDKSFVDRITTGEEDLPILTSMLVMAHNLGLEVTAEGVETAVQAERLIALGCDYLQGYHFARPEPVQAALTSASDQAVAKLTSIIGRPIEHPVVLLVEDSASFRSLVRRTLLPLGFDLDEAADGAEGLALADERTPDCVIVDLNLPDVDGVDVVRALRARPALAATAIVVLTGIAQRDSKTAAFAAGADDYIVKPLMPQHLSARLRGAMKHARRNAAAKGRT